MPNFGVGVAVVFIGVVPLASVWAGDDGADATGVGTSLPTVVVWVLSAVVWGAVAVGVGVVNTFVGFNGLTGETGLARLVGFVTDLVHVLLVVIHVPLHVGCA